MATAGLGKICRLDVRMSEQQRSLFERAAALRNQTLTQWSVAHLEEAALRDIDQATRLTLPAADFDAFSRALEEPMPRAMVDLLSTEDAWA